MVRRWEESKGTFLQDRGWKLSPSFSQLLHYLSSFHTSPATGEQKIEFGLTLKFFPVSSLSGPAVLCICLWHCKLRGCTYTQQRSRENMHKHALLEGGTVSREGAWNPSRKAYPRLQTTASPWLALLWDLHSLKENSAPSLVNKQVFKADGHFMWEMHSKVGSRRQN